MPEHGEKCGDGQQNLPLWLGEETPRQQNRCESLARIEQQSGHAKSRRPSSNVSGADVSAASQANVFSTKNAHQQVSERYGSQQVARRGGDQIRIH